MENGAYGGAKAGGIFDPVTFVQKPQVILRGVCWLFSVIVFWSISSKGYVKDKGTGRDTCLYNGSGACSFALMIGIIAFLASIVFVAGEYLFEQMSSVKSRKHYVFADLGFSCAWTGMYFIAFTYMASQWSNSKTPPGQEGVTSVQAAIFFAFMSILSWAGSAYFAYQRLLIGPGDSFMNNFDTEIGSGGGGGGGNSMNPQRLNNNSYNDCDYNQIT